MSAVHPLRRRRLALPDRPAPAPALLPVDDLFQRGLQEAERRPLAALALA